MNPIKNWLFSLSSTTFNVVIALVFFLITARITSPAFFGKVAIIQLLEVISSSVLYFVPGQIVMREVAYLHARKEVDKKVVEKFLSIPFLALPFLLTILLFPNYVRLAIPYLFLYVASNVESQEMMGMDMFKETTI
ncbi:lipopolysaccharide biosynthesis protein, partial [Acidianus sp. DSM 29099]|nr:lipopolysaccharide biosynthesis protein [Acidianus sp. RZ1]